MKFEVRHDFEISADRIMAMYSDVQFFERKYEAVGALEKTRVAHEKSNTRFHIKYQLVMKSDAPLPTAVKKFIGDSIQMSQADSWDLPNRTGRLEIEIRGAPITIGADMKLMEENGRAVNIQSWSIDCSIPLIGKKIEATISEDIKIKAARDLEASRKISEDY